VNVLEIVNARKGHPVVIQDGRFLASSIDPVREAEQWLSRIMPELKQSEGRGSLILFGLGSGYQAKVLSEILGSHAFIVIEPVAELIELVRTIHPELSKVTIISGEVTALIENPVFKDFACSRFTTLKNQNSMQLHPTYFAAVQSLLIGRERLGFLLQLKMRPELHAALDASRIEQAMTNDQTELVSIKTLQKIFSPQSQVTRERRMWKLLEELVL